MVKEEEEIIAEAGGGGRGYMDLLGLGDDDYLCLSPSSYFTSSVVSATTTTTTATAAAAASSPTCASYLDLAPAYYHHMLSFAAGQEQQYHGDGGVLGFQYHGGAGDHAVPAGVTQKFSPPATECSSSISYMSSSPPATAVSCSKPQAFKKKGSRSSEQRKAASAAAAAAAAAPAVAGGATTNKRPRVRRERLGERIIALQQLVSPFGKSDTASVLHEALGYIRFLHDQVQVLSSPYMQRQPASAAHVPESAAGTAVEPPQQPRASDLRIRGLCLVPVSCTEHIAGNTHGGGNGADLWSVAAGIAKAAAADNTGPADGMLLLPGGGGGHGRQGRLA